MKEPARTLSPRLVRAIAATHLHGAVYQNLDHLLQYGVTEYIRRRNGEGNGESYEPAPIAEAQAIVEDHWRLVSKAMTRPGVGPLTVCRAIADADPVMLDWWCEQVAAGAEPEPGVSRRIALEEIGSFTSLPVISLRAGAEQGEPLRLTDEQRSSIEGPLSRMDVATYVTLYVSLSTFERDYGPLPADLRAAWIALEAATRAMTAALGKHEVRR